MATKQKKVGFEIPQYANVNGKREKQGVQKVSFSNSVENTITISSTQMVDSKQTKVKSFDIVFNGENKFVKIYKNGPLYDNLKHLETSDKNKKNYIEIAVDKVSMHSNEDISFTLANKTENSPFKKFTIKSNQVELENNEGIKQTSVLPTEKTFFDISLPKNIVELSRNEKAPLTVKDMPTNMFDALKKNW